MNASEAKRAVCRRAARLIDRGSEDWLLCDRCDEGDAHEGCADCARLVAARDALVEELFRRGRSRPMPRLVHTCAYLPPPCPACPSAVDLVEPPREPEVVIDSTPTTGKHWFGLFVRGARRI